MVGTINPHIGLSPTSNQPMLGAHKKALHQNAKGLELASSPDRTSFATFV